MYSIHTRLREAERSGVVRLDHSIGPFLHRFPAANMPCDSPRRGSPSSEHHHGPHDFLLNLPKSEIHLLRLDRASNRQFTPSGGQHARERPHPSNDVLFRSRRGHSRRRHHRHRMFVSPPSLFLPESPLTTPSRPIRTHQALGPNLRPNGPQPNQQHGRPHAPKSRDTKRHLLHSTQHSPASRRFRFIFRFPPPLVYAPLPLRFLPHHSSA